MFCSDHRNPALEDQACDRIYRVGQKNNVFVHRWVVNGTKYSRMDQKKFVEDSH